MGLVNTRKLQESSKLTASHLKRLADLISSGQVSRISSKNALHEIIKTGKDVSQIVSELDLGMCPASQSCWKLSNRSYQRNHRRSKM